jgi:hypothetical protein
MNPAIGVLGAFLIAIGGVFVSLSLGDFIRSTGPLNFGDVIASFLGFLLFGVGLWLIVLSGREEPKQKSS